MQRSTRLSTDLTAPVTLTNPSTGEVLTLESPTGDLGRYLADVREMESYVKEAKNIVQQEILRRMDKDALYTVRVPGAGLKLSGSSPAPSEEFDELALREALLVLVDEDVVTIEAVDRAVEPVVTYKARMAGIKALRKLGGRVAEVIDGHSNTIFKTRYVRVERS